MSAYNLNDSVDDFFEFEVGGHKYEVSYPTMDQLDELRQLIEASHDKESVGEPVEGDNEKIQEWMYGFIRPVDQSPAISEVLRKQSVPVLKNFQTMIRSEFGLQ